jgi:hypothetical protein
MHIKLLGESVELSDDFIVEALVKTKSWGSKELGKIFFPGNEQKMFFFWENFFPCQLTATLPERLFNFFSRSRTTQKCSLAIWPPK